MRNRQEYITEELSRFETALKNLKSDESYNNHPQKKKDLHQFYTWRIGSLKAERDRNLTPKASDIPLEQDGFTVVATSSQ